MISGKEAVAEASQFIRDLLGDSISDLLLEELEYDDGANRWTVTLSYARPAAAGDNVIVMLSPKTRVYKKVQVDANTGMPLSMKIRENAPR